mmetsp:Transcript_61625/g.133415  ORF Transcript_61625/g.133415 Transcript_61625/m.133415 type:complete len:288 (+) Transcript_61625:72-935(+)
MADVMFSDMEFGRVVSPDAEESVGFLRQEMNSENLAGTAKLKFRHHVFLAWGLVYEWPSEVPDDCPEGSPPRLLDQALKKLAEEGGQAKIKFTLVQAANGIEEGDMMVFPDYVRFRGGRGMEKSLEALVSYLKGGAASSPVGDLEELSGSFAFVCSHAARDARCGHCGPRLMEAIAVKQASNPQPGLNVFKCSHVGGHKYAGNLLVYSGKGSLDDCHWYGYVTPENVGSVLSGKEVRGPLWRGRLGLDPVTAIRERQLQRAKAAAPVVAVSLAAALAVAFTWRRQRR